MAAILDTILDLQVSFILNVSFDGFNVSGIVKNLYIDTKMITLSAFLEKLEQFSYIPNSRGGHLGGHLEYLEMLMEIFTHQG